MRFAIGEVSGSGKNVHNAERNLTADDVLRHYHNEALPSKLTKKKLMKMNCHDACPFLLKEERNWRQLLPCLGRIGVCSFGEGCAINLSFVVELLGEEG